MKRIALLLLLLFARVAEAQIKQITGGGYQNSNGVACAGCILFLQLPVDATVTGTGQIVPNVNSYQLDANGNVPANSNLWANDQLTPSGLTYKATLTNAGGGRIWGPEFLSITGTSPISLTQLVPVASSSVFLGNPAVLNLANTFTALQTFSGGLSATNVTATGTGTYTGTNTFTGPMLCKNFENIRCAAQFSGADWCAKATAADSDLGVTSGEIWVDTNAGTSACAAAPTLSSNHVLRFIQGGTYNIGVGWTITGQNNFGIAGLPGKLTTIQFTGTAGLTIDGSSLTNLTFGAKLVDITFSGNGSITNAVTLKGVSKSYFDFSARNCTGVAVVFLGSLINTGRIVVSSNEGAFTNQPTGGVILDQFTVPSTVKSNSNDIYYVVEGVAGIGVEIKQGNANIIRGILEGNTGANGRGIQLDSTVFNTTIIAVDMESNGLEDILTNATYTFLIGDQCLSAVRVHAGASSVNTWNFGSVDPTSGCLFTTVDGGAAGLVLPNPTFGAVAANYAIISHAPSGAGSSTGSFISSNTANRFWSLPNFSATNGTTTGSIPVVIASGTATMTTAAIASLACGTTVTVSAAGVLTTDVISWSYNGQPASNAPADLTVNPWPTANNVNFEFCNPTAGSLTPSASTLNWQVIGFR